MIFATVGEQLPFDRLIRCVDEWAAATGKDVFAQTGRSAWKPSFISYKEFLSAEEFNEKLRTAELIVAHAGMGTIISAIELEKPILVMPRKAILGEVRNNHQISTARRFNDLKYISVAYDESELKAQLSCLTDNTNSCKKVKKIGPSPRLIKTIRDFIQFK